MKNKALILTLSPLLVLAMVSCSSSGASNSDDIRNTTFTSKALNSLRKGFKASGTIKTETFFFEDEDFVVKAHDIEDEVKIVNSIFTFTNSDEYSGVDYQHYNENNHLLEHTNLHSENGFLFENFVDYTNTKITEIAADEDGNPVPYATNAITNPFTLMNEYDFVYSDNSFHLNESKGTLFLNTVLSMYGDIDANIATDTNDFVFKGENLDSIKIVTSPFKHIVTKNYGEGFVNYFAKDIYTIDFAISEIAQTDSKNEINAEPHKVENEPLKVAIKNLESYYGYRINRHFKTPSSPYEETVELYFDGDNAAIYMAVYDGANPRPIKPTESDALLIDTDEDGFLNAYVYKDSIDEEGNGGFIDTGSLPELNNTFEYGILLLPYLPFLSSDVFDMNEDGSYTPVEDKLPLMASLFFVPEIAATSEIAKGAVTDFKLYLTDDKQNIDYIDLVTEMGTTVSQTRLTYDQYDTCVIPFNALDNIKI